MSWLDRFRKQSTDVVDDHGDKIGTGLDKAGDVADDKTGGKHSGQIDTGVEKAKEGLDKLDGKADDDVGGKST